jgi:hypothetical protein
MGLPEGFVFSQSSMQDYHDCPRRFQLRYLEHRRWPAPKTSDALESERRMNLGSAFHRLMTRFHSGIPAKALEVTLGTDQMLRRWWDSYRQSPPPGLPHDVVFPEIALSTRLLNYRLEARFDLLSGQRGRAWAILDWKTGRHRGPRNWWARRLQTHVYPFVLVWAGATLNGGEPIIASQVQMLYWFAQFPMQPEVFQYDEQTCRSDERMLQDMVMEIEGRSEGEFPKTTDQRRCRYCIYRSLCWADVRAGPSRDIVDDGDFEVWQEEINLEQIAAIPY